jgi:putative sterol carrier protein
MSTPELLILPQAPPSEQLPPDLRESLDRYRIDLDDGRSFILTLDHGHLSLEEGAGEATCVICCTMETFHRVLSGETNLLTAFMRGDVRMKGELLSGRRLYRFMRLSRGKGDHP